MVHDWHDGSAFKRSLCKSSFALLFLLFSLLVCETRSLVSAESTNTGPGLCVLLGL